MPKKAFLIIFLLMNGCGRAIESSKEISINELPDFSYYGQHKVDPYINIAIQLQTLGKEKAIRQLLEWGHSEKDYYRQIVILCRMLFVAREKSLFPRPALGAPSFFGKTTATDWPLEPIEIIDGVPFIIVNGYSIAGQHLPANYYIMDCYHFCDWNPHQYLHKTKEQKHEALKKLLASPKWREDAPIEFLTKQIE